MLYMDGNAKAAGALLGAATVLDDSALAREALASFERVILLCYKPGAGLAHYSDGVARVRGLLADQIYDGRRAARRARRQRAASRTR